MRVLLVEDNMPFGEEVYRILQRAFQEVAWLETESEFRAVFEKIASQPPAIAVIDVMLRWDVPRREGIRPRPADVPNIHAAGFRCAQLLGQDDRTRAIPIVLYSVLDPADIALEMRRVPDNVTFLQKTASADELVALILQVTAHAAAGQ